MKYLDPRNDIAFRKVFGQHKELCISFLNALLPLDEDGLIESVEYLDPDMLPDTPEHKNSCVDVRCFDQKGRSFIVEMQMYWTEGFLSRTLLNTAKAYAAPAKRGQKFSELKPVYALCILNDIYLKNVEYAREYKHVYSIRHERHPELRIDGMRFVFIELPKFESGNRVYNKMADLWLSFLTDVGEKTSRSELPEALTQNAEVSQAIDCIEESSFNASERYAYDRYWDAVSRERTFIYEGERRGRAEGLAEGHAAGLAEGLAEGMTKGFKQGVVDTARKLKQRNVPLDIIAETTGLSVEEIAEL